MKKSDKIGIIALVITAILTVAAVAFLPDIVRVQHSAYTGTSTDLPKIWGILLAATLSIAGVVGVKISKKQESQKCGILVISVIGYMLFAYMFIASWAI